MIEQLKALQKKAEYAIQSGQQAAETMKAHGIKCLQQEVSMLTMSTVSTQLRQMIKELESQNGRR